MIENQGIPQLLTQSMPYGDMLIQGLFFVSCARSARPFVDLMRSMIFGNHQGDYDRLLDYSTPETGAAFFAPSVTLIKQQALE